MEDTQPQVENEATPADSTETPAPEETTPFMQVKYNKEEVALDQEQATQYAQKGMNYDKVKDNLDEKTTQYDNDPARKYIQSVAKEHNISEEQVLAKFNTDRNKRLAEKQGITPDAYAAKQEIAELTAYKNTSEAEKATIAEKDSNQAKVNALLDTETAAYEKKYSEKPTQEIMDMWGKGFDMETARNYLNITAENKDLREKMGIKTDNDENAAASTGRIGSQVDGHVAELNREAIANMTPQQLDKNHSKVWEFITGVKKE